MIEYQPKRPLIFLDCDGVLNCHPPIHPEVVSAGICPERVKRFNTILDRANAQFVVSSAWRYLVHNGEMTATGLSWLLRTHGIWGRMVGVTRADEQTMQLRSAGPKTPDEWKLWPKENERGRQILEWIDGNHHLGPYLVIDDLDLGISDCGLPFVQSHGKHGLTWSDVARAIRVLKSKHNYRGEK